MPQRLGDQTSIEEYHQRIKSQQGAGETMDGSQVCTCLIACSMKSMNGIPSISPRQGRDKRPNAFAALALGSLHLHELHFDTQFISKRKSAIYLLMLVVSDKKHVQKFESSILLRNIDNTSSLRAMPAKPDYKHPECHFVMTESSSGNKNYWESIRLMRQCSSGCRVSPSPKITNLLPHISQFQVFRRTRV